jgi:hypothetical protein
MGATNLKSHWPPVLIASAVAACGVISLLVVDHGLWRRPQGASVVRYATTEAAAKAVGATVTPTLPKSALEPPAPGPKRVQPAIPEENKS